MWAFKGWWLGLPWRGGKKAAAQLLFGLEDQVFCAWCETCVVLSSIEVKSRRRDVSEEEEKTQPVERSPSSQPQRLPVFPGMDHSVLKVSFVVVVMVGDVVVGTQFPRVCFGSLVQFLCCSSVNF